MLNNKNETEVETEGDEKPSLEDRRLECIAKGDLNWIGKGFLDAIKNDCDIPKHPEYQNK